MATIRPNSDDAKFKLYKLLAEGFDAVEKAKVRPFKDALIDINKYFKSKKK